MQTAVRILLAPLSFNSRLWRSHKNSAALKFLNPQNRIQGICFCSLPFLQCKGFNKEFHICSCCSYLIFLLKLYLPCHCSFLIYFLTETMSTRWLQFCFFTETMHTMSLQFFVGCSLLPDWCVPWSLCSYTDGRGAQSDSKGDIGVFFCVRTVHLSLRCVV
jgi:hypothetical protein